MLFIFFVNYQEMNRYHYCLLVSTIALYYDYLLKDVGDNMSREKEIPLPIGNKLNFCNLDRCIYVPGPML